MMASDTDTHGEPRPGRRLSATLRGMLGRLSWAMGDQAISSLTNFAVGCFVARELGVISFGVFSLAWVTYGMVVNMSRGVGTDPLLVRFSGVPTDQWRAAAARATGTALGVGLAAGVLSLLVGLAIGGEIGLAFAALGLVLPGVLLQDSWRFAFFASGEGRKAAINDLAWALMMVPGLGLAALHDGVVWCILGWGISGGVAGVYGCFQARLLPRMSGARDWIRTQSDLGLRYLVENLGSSGRGQLRMYGVGAIAGLAAVGTIRGAELLMGPFLMVLLGFGLVAVPEASRVLRRDPQKLRRFCALLGGIQALGVLTWGAFLLVLVPDWAGQAALGAVWPAASQLILPATLAVATVAFINGLTAGLRALGASRRSMRAQSITTVLYVTGGLVGAVVADAVGSSWGVAAATTVSTMIWLWELNAALRELHQPPRPSLFAPMEPGTPPPRVSVGLPVYNGENYLEQALDTLLDQSFRDFELIISDNASTDGTEEICRRYAAIDPRIRYLRQPHNVGASPNHDVVFQAARGEFFKWAAHDDLYGRELLARCVQALDELPHVVLCHADQAIIDEVGAVTLHYSYRLATDSPRPSDRFRSLLLAEGGDDEYGLIRTEVLRTVRPQASYHNPGRPFVAEIALRGPFHQVPELLYFRRDHPDRGDRQPSVRAVCRNLDPRRATHSTARLYVEYTLGFLRVIWQAPAPARERLICLSDLIGWFIRRGLGAPLPSSGRYFVPEGLDRPERVSHDLR